MEMQEGRKRRKGRKGNMTMERKKKKNDGNARTKEERWKGII